MCSHRFVFPDDKPENYNPDSATLMGRCKCGAVQKAYGVRWIVNREDNFLQQVPYGETEFEFIDKMIEV
uniref:Uncharacterized protein n=1 Tax=viral metagenome TaxID=1070528 RepID=A0A6M3IUT1_9ZZZZ